ncbi:hypothetical protein ScPMuIL_002881 [Solemya velum]
MWFIFANLIKSNTNIQNKAEEDKADPMGGRARPPDDKNRKRNHKTEQKRTRQTPRQGSGRPQERKRLTPCKEEADPMQGRGRPPDDKDQQRNSKPQKTPRLTPDEDTGEADPRRRWDKQTQDEDRSRPKTRIGADTRRG